MACANSLATRRFFMLFNQRPMPITLKPSEAYANSVIPVSIATTDRTEGMIMVNTIPALDYQHIFCFEGSIH